MLVLFNAKKGELHVKILVGLSGGVDSAVAAWLLKQQGLDVTCAFMRNWDSMANNDFLGNPNAEDDVCPQEKDWMDARSVAETLGLPLLRVDFVREYWDDVFTRFLQEYRRGRTPNPDILCNRYIKFSSFLDYARKQGFDTLATGHYARSVRTENGSRLYKAADLNKDQSYFLCQISQDALSHTLFPLGEIDKPQVRSIAAQLQLSIADKKDSTGICFIGERNFREFLKNYLPAQEGPIVDVVSQRVLGKHQGVLYYTIGQRKGLGIGGGGGPWFVVGKDVERNELLVASGDHNEWLLSDSCLVSDMHWLSGKAPALPLTCCAKFRYRQKDNPVVVEAVDERHVRVRYPQGVSAVTPGQQAVFYLEEECLGGGVIEETWRDGISLTQRIQRFAR